MSVIISSGLSLPRQREPFLPALRLADDLAPQRRPIDARDNAAPNQRLVVHHQHANHAFSLLIGRRTITRQPSPGSGAHAQAVSVAEVQAQNAVHVEHAQMLARPAGYAEAQRPILRLFHAASVILHEEPQIARVAPPPRF